MWVWSLGQEDHLKEGIAIHSSILAWRIPLTEDPGGLQAIWSQRVGHTWVTHMFTFTGGREAGSRRRLGLPFVNDSGESIFDLLPGCGCIFSGRKCHFTSFTRLLTEPLCFCCWAIRILHIFWILSPYQIYDLQISSPICSLSLHFLHNVLWYTRF